MEFKLINCTKKEAELTFELWKTKNRNKIERIHGRGCQNCGLKESQYPNVLNIHHVDGDKRNNVMNNMKCLCFSCHKKVHHELIIHYIDSNKQLLSLMSALAEEGHETIDRIVDFYRLIK